MIPIAFPLIGDEEVNAVVRVLRSGRITRGEETRLFEEEFARYVGARYAVAVCNGTVALELALRALGVGAGDEVIVPDLTFIATANAVLNVGAKPVFADVDEKTYTIDPDSVMGVVTGRTKAIIPVHLFGHPADMDAIMEIAEDHRLYVIEDAAQAHGAEIRGVKVGSIGHVGCFSFYATKNMTMGEGGAVTTSLEWVNEKLRLLRTHGETSRYLSVTVGGNYNITEMQAAIGRVQLRKLDEMNKKRIMNAEYLTSQLKKISSVITPTVKPGFKHVFHLYVIRVEESVRDKLLEHLRAKGIGAVIHYPLPLHEQPLYRALGYPSNINPVARMLSKQLLSLPVHPALTKEDLDRIVEAVTSFFNEQ